MTYGWAILVVMIVGIVMWQLGIFNPGGTQATTMQGFGAVKPQLAGTGLSSDGQFTGTFLNAGGASIQVKKVKVVMEEPTTESASTDAHSNAATWEANANQHILATFSVGGLGNPDAGESYSASVEVTYEVRIGGTTVTRKSSGILRGPIE